MTGLQYLQEAWVSGKSSGWVALLNEWKKKGNPPLTLEGAEFDDTRWYLMTRLEMARLCGFFWYGNTVTFVLPSNQLGGCNPLKCGLYVAGSFNGWSEAVGKKEWEMKPRLWGKEESWVLTIENPLGEENIRHFKFVTGAGEWIAPLEESPVRVEDENQNVNYELRGDRRSHFIYEFHMKPPLPLAKDLNIQWSDAEIKESCSLRMGAYFYHLGTDLPLGALYSKEETVFRLFAPRAHHVTLVMGFGLDRGKWGEYSLEKEEEGTWVITVKGNWDRAYYGYYVYGNMNSPWGHFNPKQFILDPYALATVGREGPGIVMPFPEKITGKNQFSPPDWHDLVILEVHLADLLSRDPFFQESVPTYHAFEKSLKRKKSYLADSPVNAVELQPLHQNDANPPAEYHWGYMPVSYFAPHSGYSKAPASGSVIQEFQALVKAIHEKGKAVIMDVVYNHYGEPNHLLLIDKLYYFRTTSKGDLYNYSGCGNDLRTESRMVRRLVLDSLRYWVETFDVDGFRFDLAELVGVPLLEEIERELKKIKPGIILIAEPWSFRGHIARELRKTGFTSWNDYYREGIYQYIKGEGNQESIAYFLSGSPHEFATWPAQTVNYLESHDDRTLLDKLTENSDYNGEYPTLNDRRRIHLAIAIQMMSVGIPMFAQGVETLRTKRGKNNTYRDGRINAVNYRRGSHFSGTGEYFRNWVHWRLSDEGRLLRPRDPLPEGFWRRFGEEHGSAVVMGYNWEKRYGKKRLLFAINPNAHSVEIPVTGWDWRSCKQIADLERIAPDGLVGGEVIIGLQGPILTGLSCALWIS